MAERQRVSVVILTKNEEPRIARCLKSVRWADEVVIVDGESTDRTVEICEQYGARVISHRFEGSFAQERNLGLQHARGEWVLQIDADDVVTDDFRQQVERLLAKTPADAAFKFRRKSCLLGKFMRYGGWYHYLPNLVRRDAVHYVGDVHERPVVQGTIGTLEADIEHHPCEDLAAFISRHNRYTSLQARELHKFGPRFSRRILAWQLVHKPWKTFWKTYVKKQGFREGWHGLFFAYLYAWIELLKWAKYWELRQRSHTASLPPTAPAPLVKRALFSVYLVLQAAARACGGMRVRPLRKLSRSLYTRLRCEKPVQIRCNGLRWVVDTRDEYFTLSLIVEGWHEPYESAFLSQWLRAGMTVLDVGAHVGWYTLLAARQVGSTGRVIAFEPDPWNFTLLTQNITANRYDNVETTQRAVADRGGDVQLLRDEHNYGGHRLALRSEAVGALTVQAIALDDWYAAHGGTVDLIKMDIEGAELLAWQGMRRLLHDNRQVRLMMEFCPEALRRCGTEPQALVEAWDAEGFIPHWLNGQAMRLEPVNLEDLLAICQRGDGHTNVFLLQGE